MAELLKNVDNLVWGPGMLVLLLGTGIYLMLRMRFLPLRNLGYAIRCLFQKEEGDGQEGEISALASLTTELAATIGTGNIVGVATAMVMGGPGALVWMILSALIGLSTKFAESMLAVKYRAKNEAGTVTGGPMYTLQSAFPNKKAGSILGMLFALFAVLSSFGMGNMAQSNSITLALAESFDIPQAKSGLVITILVILVILGGIRSISKITLYMVPCMALFYIIGA
ncbi:MAG: sodium:alanine symporter family protein, partial [Lachnospiraceae bacterium]|nr:sodium:alanine symporter family protein [Lachnospiraceae bacterium]